MIGRTPGMGRGWGMGGEGGTQPEGRGLKKKAVVMTKVGSFSIRVITVKLSINQKGARYSHGLA